MILVQSMQRVHVCALTLVSPTALARHAATWQRIGPPVRIRQASGRLCPAVAVLAVLNSVDLYLPVYIENTNESDIVLPASQGLRVALLQVTHGSTAHPFRCAAFAARQYRPSPRGTTM